MKKILIGLVAGSFLFSGAAFAQINNPGVKQNGSVTAGHFATWSGPNTIQDGGSPSALPVTCGQLPAFTGDVTKASASCALVIPTNTITALMLQANSVITAKIQDAAVTFAKIQNLASHTIFCNETGGAAAGHDCTVTQIKTFLSYAFSEITGTASPSQMTNCNATTSGSVPTPPNNTTTFLRGDCSFATPPNTTTLPFTSITGQATLAQLPSIADKTVLGNRLGSTTTPQQLSSVPFLDLANTFSGSPNTFNRIQFNGSGTPTATACGTGPGSPTGTDENGTIAQGTSTTSCVIHFASGFISPPRCFVSHNAQLSSSPSVTATAADLTVTQVSTSGAVMQWLCIGN